MKKTPSEKVEKWLKLNKEGHFQEAKDFYFESLFAAIIEYFKERTAGRPSHSPQGMDIHPSLLSLPSRPWSPKNTSSSIRRTGIISIMRLSPIWRSI